MSRWVGVWVGECVDRAAEKKQYKPQIWTDLDLIPRLAT